MRDPPTPLAQHRLRRYTARRAELRAHADRMVAEHGITWHIGDGEGSYAIYDLAEVVTPPIRGRVSDAVALQEIGHIVGRYQRDHANGHQYRV